MDPLFQIQADAYAKLASEDLLAHVPVTTYRKLVLEREFDVAGITMTASRAGHTGTGLVVLLPTITVPNAEAPGPTVECQLGVLSLENPGLRTPLQSTAEQNGLTVLSMFTQPPFVINGLGDVNQMLGCFYAAQSPLTPDEQWKGLIAYRVQLRCMIPLATIAKVPLPEISEDEAPVGDVPGTYSLACALSGASIYYTLNKTSPARPDVNPDALPYDGPFTAPLGTTVRWVAYYPALQGSDFAQAKVSA